MMETTSRVIDRLFYRMKCAYGSYWIDMIRLDPIDEVKSTWLAGLEQFSADDIGLAIKAVKGVYNHLPPDLLQFSELVSNLKHCKPGYQSFGMYQSQEMGKVSQSVGSEYLRQIKGILIRPTI